MEKDVSKVVSINLCKLRKLKKLTQAELANKFNFSDKTISKWESGESLPSIDVLYKLAEFYGVSLSDLANENLEIEEFTKSEEKRIISNKVIISLLVVSLVWLIATIVYVVLKLFNVIPDYAWLSFIYALPVSFIVCIIFSAVFFKKQKYSPLILCIFESLFVWTGALSICLSINFTQIWLILFIAIPLQILIILWNIFKRKKY